LRASLGSRLLLKRKMTTTTTSKQHNNDHRPLTQRPSVG
jgi:hypothetical protein